MQQAELVLQFLHFGSYFSQFLMRGFPSRISNDALTYTSNPTVKASNVSEKTAHFPLPFLFNRACTHEYLQLVENQRALRAGAGHIQAAIGFLPIAV